MHLWKGRHVSGLTSIQTHYYNRILQLLLNSVGGLNDSVRTFSSGRSEAISEHVSLSVPTFMVWGANTGVGKTLVSAALAREASSTEVTCP